jgi:2-oxoglutarate dehydrogenase E2 component (dihydrolipoamide succinyltransferase)
MGKVEVTMPKMGESITEGTVVTWHKKPGDKVEMDESLLEIGTDKVDTDVPSPSDGTLLEIRVDEGETVEVGTVIAVIDTNGEAGTASEPTPEAETETEEDAEPDLEEGESEAPADAKQASADSGTVQTEKADSSRKTTDAPGKSVDVVMPKMGESVMEGTVLHWFKKVGDEVDLDEALLEIATDKVDTEVPSPAAGTLKEIVVPEGETVEVGTLIAILSTGSGGEAGSAGAAGGTGRAAEEPASAEEETTPELEKTGEAARTAASARHSEDGRFLSPLVRSIAEKEGLGAEELSSVQGSGRNGRITKEDILQYVRKRGERPAPAREGTAGKAATQEPASRVLSPSSPVPPKMSGDRVEIVKMDRMRQLIAEHMIRSKTTSAHVTSFAEADVTNLVRLRERNKAAFLEREGVKLTYTPFFVYAAVEALREHPILNASVLDDAIHYQKDYHIGIAVAIGTTGLVVPVIRDAGQKNIVGLAHAAADLAERSRTKQLMPDELQGGTFTVTNVGSLGSIMGTPIINQPQLGILATGAIKKRPVVIEDEEMGDTIGIRQMMYVSLSYDHRVVDGAMGSSFLARFVDVIESFDPKEVIK